MEKGDSNTNTHSHAYITRDVLLQLQCFLTAYGIESAQTKKKRLLSITQRKANKMRFLSVQIECDSVRYVFFNHLKLLCFAYFCVQIELCTFRRVEASNPNRHLALSTQKNTIAQSVMQKKTLLVRVLLLFFLSLAKLTEKKYYLQQQLATTSNNNNIKQYQLLAKQICFKINRLTISPVPSKSHITTAKPLNTSRLLNKCASNKFNFLTVTYLLYAPQKFRCFQNCSITL